MSAATDRLDRPGRGDLARMQQEYLKKICAFRAP